MHSPRFRYFAEPQDGPAWKSQHIRFNSDLFSASVIPDLMGVGYKSRTWQYDLVKGLREDKDISNLPHIKFGKESEPIAKQDFQKAFPFLMCITPGIAFHADYPFIAATSDLLCISKETGETLNVEIKCKYNGELPETAQAVLPRVLIQANTQMEVLKLSHTVLWFWTAEKQIGWLMPYSKDLWDLSFAAVQDFRKVLEDNKRPTRTTVKPALLKCIAEVQNSLKKIY